MKARSWREQGRSAAGEQWRCRDSYSAFTVSWEGRGLCYSAFTVSSEGHPRCHARFFSGASMSITYRHKQVTAVTTGIMYSLLSSLGFVWVIRSQLRPSVTNFMVHPTWPPFSSLSPYPVVDSSRKLQNPRCWH